jgi:hypothetical protein
MKKYTSVITLAVAQGFIPMTIFCISHKAFGEAIICTIGWAIATSFVIIKSSKAEAIEDIPMEVTYNGQTFKDAETLHEWREQFEFDYFLDNASQN